MKIKQSLSVGIISFLLIMPTSIFAQATFLFNQSGSDFQIIYSVQTILNCQIRVEVNNTLYFPDSINAQIDYQEYSEPGPNGGIIQVGVFQLISPANGKLVFQGSLQGNEAFPANPGWRNTQIIRTVSGFSSNRLNSGVYSRKHDWALLFKEAEERFINFRNSSGSLNVFHTVIKGKNIKILFKSGYYHTHLGLTYFNPSKFEIYPKQPMGWISWKAYQAIVTEQNIRDAADWCEIYLKPFGLSHIIIDDGWFVGSTGSGLYQIPQNVNWTQGNRRFPNGMAALADYIHQKGFKAGIWLSPFGISDQNIMNEHPDWWVRQYPNGPWATSNKGWHGPYFADGSVDSAITRWILNGICAMDQDGYDFFKLDGQMHAAHEAYVQGSSYFASKGITWQQAYRHAWKAIMDSTNDEFVLSCWSRIPENIGNPHAIRIGGDKDAGWNYGPKPAADDLAKYLYEHNICWIDDPDHIVLSGCSLAESRSWVTLIGLTGTMFTFSDIPQNLPAEKVEMYRKILPTISTHPLELYQLSTTPALWCLEVNKPFDNWLVVANTHFASNPPTYIAFTELGLDSSKEYIVYDFWKEQLKGVFSRGFYCSTPQYHDVDVYSIRQKRDYPWVASVNRHISQGGISFKNLSYNDSTSTLSGTSRLVPNDHYIIHIYYPDGFQNDRVSVSCGSYNISLSQPNIIDLDILSPCDTLINWSISFGGGPTGILAPVRKKPRYIYENDNDQNIKMELQRQARKGVEE